MTTSSGFPKLDLKLFTESIPIFTGIILVSELTKQYLYYKMFNLNISDYITFSFLFNKFLFSVSRFILYFSTGSFIFGLIFPVANGIYFKQKEKSLKKAVEKQVIDDSAVETQINVARNKLNNILLLLMTIIAVILLIYSFTYPDTGIYCRMLGFAIVSIVVVFYYIKNTENNFLLKLRLLYFAIGYAILIFYICMSLYDFVVLYGNDKARIVCIEFNTGEIIPAHSTRYYIGRTPEYIFVYNQTEQCTKVYNASEVKYMTSYKELK